MAQKILEMIWLKIFCYECMIQKKVKVVLIYYLAFGVFCIIPETKTEFFSILNKLNMLFY